MRRMIHTLRPCLPVLSVLSLLTACGASAAPAPSVPPSGVWPAEKAREWGDKAGWLVGSNFIPSTAINELEMWQDLDAPTIDRELGWAEQLGFNSMRVFLHNIPWEQDPKAFLDRIDQFLIDRRPAPRRHHLRPVRQLLGPVPRARQAARAEARRPQLRLGPVPGQQRTDGPRQPRQAGGLRQGRRRPVQGRPARPPVGRLQRAGQRQRLQLREGQPEGGAGKGQEGGALAGLDERGVPLGTGSRGVAAADQRPWQGDWSSDEKLSETSRFQFEQLRRHQLPHVRRPARDAKAGRDAPPLPAARWSAPSTWPARAAARSTRSCPTSSSEKIAAYNWGFVAGKTNTIYPWDSWQHPYPKEPQVWFHDIFRNDGKPFDTKETDLIRRLTGKNSDTR